MTEILTTNRFNVKDRTTKGVVVCVMVSRHPQGSRYMMANGKTFTEWQIEE